MQWHIILLQWQEIHFVADVFLAPISHFSLQPKATDPLGFQNAIIYIVIDSK